MAWYGVIWRYSWYKWDKASVDNFILVSPNYFVPSLGVQYWYYVPSVSSDPLRNYLMGPKYNYQ
jgi:hypothetical protein